MTPPAYAFAVEFAAAVEFVNRPPRWTIHPENPPVADSKRSAGVPPALSPLPLTSPLTLPLTLLLNL
jgi:hypothetical protein